MTPDTALGLSVEFGRFLKGDWAIVEEPERFRIKNKDPSVTGVKLKEYIRDTAWQIAREMGYRNFVSISEDPEGRITIKSRSSPDNEFEIVFEI
jgi:hypothetical protein